MEAFVLASGPSLTPEDAERVRVWRSGDRKVIVTNTTFRLAPWADVLYAMDARWWSAKPDSTFRTYADEAKATFAGELVTCSQAAKQHGLVFGPNRWKWQTTLNSGAGAIFIAHCMGAKRIYLLGFDCKGNTHWHGRHPKPLTNCLRVNAWPGDFNGLAARLRGKAEVFNCTRDTALKVFPRMTLEDALQGA